MQNISVLICDDSSLMRNLIGRIIDETDGLQVVGKATDGLDLLLKLQTCKPDVILLDIEMPKMNGVEFLKQRKLSGIKIPVIVLSSIATEGAIVTMKCLSLGASDFITKPGGNSVDLSISSVSNEIIEYVASYGGAYAKENGKQVPDPEFYTHQIKLKEAQKFVAQKKGDESAKKTSKFDISKLIWTPSKQKEAAVIVPEHESGRIEIIAIGISTGGPNALREMFKELDGNIKQPIVVVQHMPAGFTKEFAESLNQICPLNVKEAEDNELLVSGTVYIAPGNYHVAIAHKPSGNCITLSQAEPRNGHRPSADVLFESVAELYQNRALGIIMTGMGKDGAVQLAEMRKKGAWTLGQDKDSSVVYGMPKVAWELGAVQKQLPLNKLAGEINNLALTKG